MSQIYNFNTCRPLPSYDCISYISALPACSREHKLLVKPAGLCYTVRRSGGSMRHKDYLPPSGRCIKCQRRLPLQPGQPVCHHCFGNDRIIAVGRSRYRASVRAEPKHHPLDSAILHQLAGTACSVEWLYNKAYDRQHGRCSRCRHRFSMMRSIPSLARKEIHHLLCPKCFNQRTKRAARPKTPLTIDQLLWAHADPIMRFLLLSNPSFQRKGEEKA